MAGLKLATVAAAAVTFFLGANAASTSEGDFCLPSCAEYTPFVYSGCYNDAGSPATQMYTTGLDASNMTVEKCTAFCKGMLSKHPSYGTLTADEIKAITIGMLHWQTMENVIAVLLSMPLKPTIRNALIPALEIQTRSAVVII